MRTDFDSLNDGDRITLFPRHDQPFALHKKPVCATFSGGFFYVDGSPPYEGPDYYMGDVLRFCEGFEAEVKHG